jgi:hypothetical protein
MAYDQIQPAAFVHDPATGPLHAWHRTLAFPAAWREPILELYRHGKAERTQARIKQVPIKRLNAVMRTLAPDLVAVDANASFDQTRPWLYADAGYPQALMDNFLHAWLYDMQPSPEAYPLLKETVRKLNAQMLRWTPPTPVDLLEQATSEGGTSLPASHLYRVLPEILAARVAQLPAYEHCGRQISFRRIAVDARASGAELMSWPPLDHETKTRADGVRAWHYSAVVRISLRTVPFSPLPRIHVSTSIRRWVSGPVWIPAKGGVSVYLLADNALVPNGPAPARFAVAKLVWDHRTGKTRWDHGGPEGMLVRLSALENLPPADVLAKKPEEWIPRKDGLTAAVTYSTSMGWHGVGAGLMPSERRRLVEWAAQALSPEFQPIGAPRKSLIAQQNPARVLERNRPVPQRADDEERAEIKAANEQRASRNADRRRRHVAEAVGERGLTALVLYQTEEMRNHLLGAAERSLGLAPYPVVAEPGMWSWRTPELTVRIHAHPLGALGGPLGGDQAPRRGDELDEAISRRRAEVAAFLAQLLGEMADPAQLAFVELEGPERFKKRTSDPKFAVRLGCVDAGTVSQFLKPRDLDIPDEDDDSELRASAAWADGLRQIGSRFVPEHTLGDAIPEHLNQLAFWMVKRRTDGPTKRPQFTPVAVLIRPRQRSVMGKTSEMSDWVPYPELLKGLAGTVRPDDLKTEEQQVTAAATFIRNTLYRQKGEPTLVVTHAQNTRYRWPWLKNSGLVTDRVQIGGGPLQRLALLGKQLCVARVATGDRDETPEWWAPKPGQRGGLAKGLWVPAGSDGTNRVFYSTSEKASTHPISVDASKLTPHLDEAGEPRINPGQNAWNPELLEFTMVCRQPQDDPEHWAMYLHQQRQSDDYRDSLGLPLILHLAELTSHYALPHEEVGQLQAEDEASVAEQSDLLTNPVEES